MKIKPFLGLAVLMVGVLIGGYLGPQLFKFVDPIEQLGQVGGGRGATLYVDNSLETQCVSGDYSVAGHDCSGSAGNAYLTIQRAIDAASAGDTIKIRQNNSPVAYQLPDLDGNYIAISKDDLVIESYGDERAVICGNRLPDDAPGQATRLSTCGSNEVSARTEDLLTLTASGTTVRGLELAYAYGTNGASGRGIVVRGDNNIITHNLTHHNYSAGILLNGPSASNPAEYNQIIYNENYKGCRIAAGVSIYSQANHNLIANNLIYLSGYADDDSACPGLSAQKDYDGLMVVHGNCRATDTCSYNEVKDNVVADVLEDGADLSAQKNTYRRNIFLNSAANGIKQFSNDDTVEIYNQIQYVQNIVVGSTAPGGIGLMNSGGREGRAFHNLATRNLGSSGSVGISIQADQDIQAYNNIAFNNGGGESQNIKGVYDAEFNRNSNSNTGLTNSSAVFDTTIPVGTIEEKLAFIRDQVVAAFQPVSDGVLVDAGVGSLAFINWRTGEEESLVYNGSAPDIGPIESAVGTIRCGAWDGQCPAGCDYVNDDDLDCQADSPGTPDPTPTYTLTITASNGSVAQSPSAASYDSGTQVTLTATPDTGYEFTSWSGDASGVTNPLTLTMNADKSVTANFTLSTHTITATAGANGAISPSGAVSVNPSANQSFTITPNTGYQIATLTVDDGNVATSSTYTFVNVTSDHSINVTFSANDPAPSPTYSLVTAVTPGSNAGRVAKSPSAASYDSGAQVTLTATADSGYEFVNWSGDASSATNPLTVTMNADKSITANFRVVSGNSVASSNQSGGGGGGGSGRPRDPTPPPSAPPSLPSSTLLAPSFIPLVSPMAVGVRSPHVTQLQQMLARDGVYAGTPTGFYDQATIQAVQAFQRKHGLLTQGSPDSNGYGLAGPQTRAKLNELYAYPSTLPTPNSQLILNLQRQLLLLLQQLYVLLTGR